MQLCTCSIFISSSFHFILESLIDNKLQQQQQQQPQQQQQQQQRKEKKRKKIKNQIYMKNVNKQQ